MTLRKQKINRGFAALITAIILSSVLIMATVTLSRSGFFVRSAILESEYKEASSALAEACADIAMLKLVADFLYAGDETMNIKGGSCVIKPVQKNMPSFGQHTLETTATFHDSITNMKIVVSGTDFSVISWIEILSF